MKQLSLPLFAFDRAIEVPAGTIAFDKASVRTIDADGRMHVAVTNISKANVCPYLGREIPDYDKLGLDPDHIYQLYRDPEELAKAAPTFNNIQLLVQHIPVSADDHQPDLVVGTTGSEAEFVAPYLRNSLAVWVREGIDLIESEKQSELSPAYRYRVDMTPGRTPQGEAFDGVMRDIEGNHVCLVKEGRTGSDVFVADSAIPKLQETFEMSKANLLSRKASVAQGALMVFLKPKLAKDAKIDLSSVLTGLTSKNFKEKKAALVAGVTALTKDKLAKDGKMDGLIDLIDALAEVEPVEGEDDDVTVDPDDAGMDADPVEAMRGFLKGKMADDDVERACAMMKPKAMDETPEEKAEREKKEKAEAESKTAADKVAKDAEGKEKDKEMVEKPAMDAAIKIAEDAATKRAEANTMKRLNGIRIAERAVEPLIGKVTTALDSADAIYLAALKHVGVKTEGVDPSAFPALVDMAVQSAATKAKPQLHLAHDAAVVTDRAAFEKANGIEPLRIRNLG